jgi:5'-methylthioadenosine phosphorylase
MILATLHDNVAQAKRILRAAASAVAETRTCPCGSALQYAIVTSPEMIPAATRKRLQLLIGKYLGAKPKSK